MENSMQVIHSQAEYIDELVIENQRLKNRLGDSAATINQLFTELETLRKRLEKYEVCN